MPRRPREPDHIQGLPLRAEDLCQFADDGGVVVDESDGSAIVGFTSGSCSFL